MTVWILHQHLTPEEETKIEQQTHLRLPFIDLPDLTLIKNRGQAKKLLLTLHPSDPPESIERKLERFWKLHATIQSEDIIAVPLLHAKHLALAEVIGNYAYQVNEQGEDLHLIPVKFYPKRLAIKKLNKHMDVLDTNKPPMYEVTDKQARVCIRDHIPASYNRFVKFKWLYVLFFMIGLIRIISQMVMSSPS